MSIADKFNKKTIILLAALIVIGGVAAAYYLFFGGVDNAPPPEPERIAMRIKIEAPPLTDVKEEAAKSPGVQTSAQAPVQVPPVQQGAAKPTEVKPEIKKKEEIKTAVKELVPEKKKEIKEGKQRSAAGKKMAYKPWAVHVASYMSKEEALAMVKRLKQNNYNAYMTEFNLKGKYWYRVRIGFYASDREAKSIGKKISGNYSMSGMWTVKPNKKEIMSHLN